MIPRETLRRSSQNERCSLSPSALRGQTFKDPLITNQRRTVRQARRLDPTITDPAHRGSKRAQNLASGLTNCYNFPSDGDSETLGKRNPDCRPKSHVKRRGSVPFISGLFNRLFQKEKVSNEYLPPNPFQHLKNDRAVLAGITTLPRKSFIQPHKKTLHQLQLEKILEQHKRVVDSYQTVKTMLENKMNKENLHLQGAFPGPASKSNQHPAYLQTTDCNYPLKQRKTKRMETSMLAQMKQEEEAIESAIREKVETGRHTWMTLHKNELNHKSRERRAQRMFQTLKFGFTKGKRLSDIECFQDSWESSTHSKRACC